MSSESVLAWHFLPQDRRLTHGDGRLVEVGQTLTMPKEDLPLAYRGHGLHASVMPLEALKHAPGPILCRVAMAGEIQSKGPIIVASQRRILHMDDVSDLLHEFAVGVAEKTLAQIDTPDQRWSDALLAKRRWLLGDTDREQVLEAWGNAWLAAQHAEDHIAWSVGMVAALATNPEEAFKSALHTSEEAIRAALVLSGHSATSSGHQSLGGASQAAGDLIFAEQNRDLERLLEQRWPSG